MENLSNFDLPILALFRAEIERARADQKTPVPRQATIFPCGREGDGPIFFGKLERRSRRTTENLGRPRRIRRPLSLGRQISFLNLTPSGYWPDQKTPVANNQVPKPASRIRRPLSLGESGRTRGREPHPCQPDQKTPVALLRQRLWTRRPFW